LTLKSLFWKGKSLPDFSEREWEALCDGCGQCCQYKLEDEDTGDLYLTNVVCRFLDLETCRCSVYPERHDAVPTCVQLTPQNILSLEWIPPTCAYKLIAEGKPLSDWHPLVSADQESIHNAGISVRGRVISESGVDMDHLEDFVISK